MSKHDLKRLKYASDGLADRLRSLRLPSLRFASALAQERHGNGGWSTEIAAWSKHDVTIGISLDQYPRAQRRSFWVGFWSRDYASIQRLFIDRPLEWRPQGPELKTTDAIDQIDGDGKEIWVMKRPLPNVRFGQPIIEDYEDDYKYFGLYDRSDELDLEQAINFLEAVIAAQEQGTDDEATDIRNIEHRKDLNATEKERLILARRGQGYFRKELEKIWNCCPISRHTRRELLRASHIMPWRDANDTERLDKYNGILLSANLDALFDKHLISFAEDGTLLVSNALSVDERTKLGLTENITLPFSEKQQFYLKHHRDRFRE